MDAVKFINKAFKDFVRGKITLHEYAEIIKPMHDVVPVIRCKDCKHYERDFGNDWGVCCKWTVGQVGITVDAGGFCYKAERRKK